ncbi:MAG: TonB-dependent receptor plug domain-containing protein [Myxococcota bacterium]
MKVAILMMRFFFFPVLLTSPAFLWAAGLPAEPATPPATPPATTEPIEVVEERPTGPLPTTRTPGPVEVVELQTAVSASDLATVLEGVPGVTLQRLGMEGGSSFLSVRGATPGQLQVYLDGVPLSHPAQGALDLAQLPLAGVERLELYPGSSPLAFGANAMGGVLNLVTGELQGGISGQAWLGVGSFGDRRLGGLVTADAGAQRWRLMFNARQARGDYVFYNDGGTDYALSDDGVEVLQNHDHHQLESLLRLEQAFDRGRRLQAQLSYVEREQGILGLGQGQLETSARYGAQAGMGYLKLSAPGAVAHPLELGLTLDTLWREERLSDPLGEVSLSPQTSVSQATSWGGLGQVLWVPSSLLSLEGMVLARREGLRGVTSGTRVGRVRVGAGGQAELLLPRLLLQPGILLDFVQPEEATGQVLLSPRLGFELRLPAQVLPELGRLESRLVGAGGRFHRTPTFLELYGNQGVVQGNPALKPEEGVNVELGSALGVVRDEQVVRLELQGYLRRAEQTILYVQNSQNTVKPINAAASEVQGLTLSLELERSLCLTRGSASDRRWSASDRRGSASDRRGSSGWGWRLVQQTRVASVLGWSWLRALDRSGIPSQDGLQLPGLPRHAVTWELKLGPPGLEAFYRLSGRSETALEPSHTLLNPGRVLQDVGLRWELGRRSPLPVGETLDGLTVGVEVRNLSDMFYQTVSYVPTPQMLMDALGFPLPGRAFYVTVRWEASVSK